jgi:hypothetical protein
MSVIKSVVKSELCLTNLRAALYEYICICIYVYIYICIYIYAYTCIYNVVWPVNTRDKKEELHEIERERAGYCFACVCVCVCEREREIERVRERPVNTCERIEDRMR